MPVRLPSPQEIGLTPLHADRPMASFQGGIAAQGAEQEGAAVAQAGQQITQTGAAFQNAQDLVAMAGANSAFLQKKIQLDQQFENDTDYATKAQRYGDAIQQAANESAASIGSGQLRTQFLDRTLRWQQYGIESMQRQAHYEGVAADQGYVKANFNSTLDGLVKTPDEPTRVGMIQAFDTSVDAMAAKGSITPAQAVTYKQQLRTQYATKKAETILNTDPGLAARLLAPDAPPVAPGVSSDLQAGIHRASATYGVPEDWLARTAQLESAGGRETGPSRAGASGPFQLMPAVAVQYGANAKDAGSSADAAAQLYKHNLSVLQDGLGRQPDGAEMYLAHQQGAAGALALLTHPDENAVDALSPFYRSRQAAQAAITDNGGSPNMTASQFSGMWANRWSMTPGAPGSVGSHPTADATETDSSGAPMFQKTGDWRDFLPPNLRAEMWRQGVSYAQGQQKAALADTQRQILLEQRTMKLQSENAEGKVIADTMGVGENPKITAQQIADPNGPYAALTPEARTRMIDFFTRNATGSDNKDVATYGTGFYDLYRRVHAPDGDPNRITDPSMIYDATGPGRALTLAGAKQLVSDLKARGTPEGEADQTMLRQFITNARNQITGTSEGLHIKDPKGDELFLRFLAKVLPEYDQQLKAGKSAADLLDPGSKDYLGASITSFKRPLSQWTADMMGENDLAPGTAPAAGQKPPAIDMTSRDGIVAAYRSGRISRQEAAQALVSRGFAIQPAAPPTAAPAPASGTAGLVPTNG